jgi:hypothetical protein
MTNTDNEYFNVMIPDLIKDVARQAISGNEQAKQRLEVIRNFTADTLDAINNKPKPFFKPKSREANPYANSANQGQRGMKPKRQS